MERQQHSSKKDNISLNGSQASNMSGSHGSKKWSFGRLFRKKKEIESASSSEEDRKAGFSPANKFPRNSNSKSKSKGKNNRNSKLIGAGFDHIVVNPQQQQQDTPPPVKRPPPPQNLGNEFFLPFETAATPEPFYHNQQQTQATHYPQPQQYLLQPQQQQLSRSSNSLDRRAINASLSPNVKSHSAQRLAVAPGTTQVPVRSSSEEELISLNSSTFSKYRSDESLHSGGQAQNGQSRRSRAARNERYYKRLSRDGEVSHGQVPVMYAPQPAQRWKTQPVPLSIYNAPAAPPVAPLPQVKHQPSHPSQLQVTTSQRLRNAGSLQHVTPYVQWGHVQKQPKNLQNSVNDNKRSISYDSHIHLQNVNGRLQTKPLPPPPPPRDPTRRLNVSGHVANSSSGELRPLSYAFDVSGVPATPATGLNGRCVSDDKIWASQAPLYQSAQSLNVTPSTNIAYQQPTTHRRFITRAERDAHPGKKSLPNGLDMHYIADATPRSRKPIHLLEQQDDLDYNRPPPSSGILRTTKSGLPSPSPKAVANDFWKRLDEGAQTKASTPTKPVSSARPNELRSYPSPMYSEVYKPNRKPQTTKASPEPKALQTSVDEVDHVVCGSLHIKPTADGLTTNNYVEIRSKDNQKSHSMPNHYQRRSGCEILKTPNKYEEYVAEKREQHHNLTEYPPTPPQRKLSTPLVDATLKSASQPPAPVYLPHKKPANLEEAISELEAIYKSLRLGKEPVVERKERVPTPSEFEKFALARADSYDDDEDSPAGEADPITDDVAYRNMKLANLQHKTAEKQPPFGIPIGPIVPSAHNDYLHVSPDKNNKKVIVVPKRVPDIIKDDLAVRALRKDAPGPKPHFIYPSGSLQKKNRATRTQSANIYSLIQRDAAKPSGGDFFSFMELTKSIDRSGSMSDLHHGESPADIPATLQLLMNLKEQDQEQSVPKKLPLHSIPFRHPSQGGAICQLPEKLTCNEKEEAGKPVPMPRKSLTPEPSCANHQMEDALNKIAKDAQESSAKLTKELRELRKEALITASRPKMQHSGEAQIEQDLQEIEAVSEAAKRCGKMLLDTLPDSNGSLGQNNAKNKPRKLHKEGKLIEAIDQVSEAANAVCEKILKDIVTTEPPVVVQEAIKVQNTRKEENLVMPNLIKKLDPVKSEAIEAIARRCMRQISELSETTDYDNLAQAESDSQPACNDLNAQAGVITQLIADENLPSTVSEKQKRTETSRELDEIDRIMQECEAQVHSEGGASTTATVGSQQLAEDKTTAPSLTNSCSSSNSAPGKVKPTHTSSTTASSFSSSSDCLAKSSSPSAGRRLSSSITSFNPYSSSDYIKSPSSDFHAPSTDPIKTFSTTSYDVQSTSETPNITTNSTFSYSPSPPLNLTPIGERERERAAAVGNGEVPAAMTSRERSSSPSQYNSSEELAMIFGIEEKPKQQQQRRRKLQQQQQLQMQQQQQAHPDETLV